MLADDYDLVHISVGDIFRWNIQAHTKLAARIKRIVNSGKLVPDKVVEQIVRARLEEHDWNYGFITKSWRNCVGKWPSLRTESYSRRFKGLAPIPVRDLIIRQQSRCTSTLRSAT